MSIFDSQLETFRDELEKKMQPLRSAILSGGCKTLEDYREKVGKLRAFEEALQLMQPVVVRSKAEVREIKNASSKDF